MISSSVSTEAHHEKTIEGKNISSSNVDTLIPLDYFLLSSVIRKNRKLAQEVNSKDSSDGTTALTVPPIGNSFSMSAGSTYRPETCWLRSWQLDHPYNFDA